MTRPSRRPASSGKKIAAEHRATPTRAKATSNSAESVEVPLEHGRSETLSYLTGALIAIALIYAFLAGFRTVYDLDLGWQLASGRWIVQHHQIPSTDVLSYTARGRPWIYPVLSGVAFYVLYLMGGYAALTWLTAIASAVTTFFLTRQRTLPTAILAIVAVPLIVLRLTVRADLFTTVLFAAVLSVLWTYHRTGNGMLWLLPVLSLLWVNLHWGFVTALGLCAAYVMLEAAELPFAERRKTAIKRLRRARPWLLASGLATLANPWGPKLYAEVVGWGHALARSQSAVITEFVPLRVNLTTLEGILLWRDPDFSAIWWLLVAASIATIAALARRSFGAAILLAGSAVPAILRWRFQGLFACVVVVVGGAVLSETAEALFAAKSRSQTTRFAIVTRAIAIALCACFVSLAGFRVYDLVSNRFYLNKEMPEVFGSGLSWWYPERATAFIEREHLPGNLFNVWSLGGYLAWRLPQYPDFIDSRGRPFSQEVFSAALDLPAQDPDSAAWLAAAERWGIHTIVVAAGRYGGMADFPSFRNFCDSAAWRPVYLDEVSAVFLRRGPGTQAIIDRFPIDCKTVRFTPPQVNRSSRRGRAELFNFWGNTADMLYELGRGQEALQALDVAEGCFPDSGPLRLERGFALANLGRTHEAEQEFHRSVELRPDENSWAAWHKLLLSEGRQDEAERVLRKVAELSSYPQHFYLELGRLELQRQHPAAALADFDKATKYDILQDTASGAEFRASIAEGRAVAWYGLADASRAIEFEKQAVQFTPSDKQRWKNMAKLYEAIGRTSDAQLAMQHAQ